MCLEAGAIDTLLVNLKSNSSHMLVVTCGTFLNLSMDNEPIQHEIVQKGGMSHLFNLVKYAADSNIRRMYPDVGANAIRVISNLVEIGALNKDSWLGILSNWIGRGWATRPSRIMLPNVLLSIRQRPLALAPLIKTPSQRNFGR